MELPPELVDIIIAQFWYSELPSNDRITFMTACPLVNITWRDVYARVTSRDIHVPTVAYLLYLPFLVSWKPWSTSAVYGDFSPDSVRTITCYVDLTSSKNDAAKDPYSALCNLPNYLGFRRCFPNLEQINLGIKFRAVWYWNGSFSRQLFQTRLSINLRQATSELSLLPVEWSIAVHCPPKTYEDPPIIAHILEGITTDMVQLRHTLPISAVIKESTYHHGARHFQNEFCITEKRGDVRFINYYLGAAASRPWHWVRSVLYDGNFYDPT
ncbi:hypothetical protein EDD18DRAFT_1106524 [Armillaria luteobubalina]|uniref:Uncharacterized protein n=1 Tax=Armillaria luteobubalina TaxID=153913 RepID=A0AA39Q501_9AGAR|nr:hypothetical protein EDD18DRAFT_1106524 [Armillaria luteobubalina]